MPVRQVGRYREAGRALHGRPGRRPVGRAGDRVALPVAGHGAVPGLGGPLRSSPSGRGTGACARRRPAWGGGRPGPTGASPRCRARAGPLDRAQTAWHLVSWQALILGEIVAVYPLGLFHAPTMPVREGAPVAAGRPHAPVPPQPRRRAWRPNRLGRLREVHAAGDEPEVLSPTRLLHLPRLSVDGSVEFAAHRKHPFQSRVLQRSLESAPSTTSPGRKRSG